MNNQNIYLKKTTLHLRKSIGQSPLRLGFLLMPLAFGVACLALLPQARADCREGCGSEPSNTFLGDDALLNNNGFYDTAVGGSALTSNTSGYGNTATGFEALRDNTNGVNNTADGVSALSFNTSGSPNTATGALSECELYDPNVGTWSVTASMSTPRYGARAALLLDGRVLEAGGNTDVNFIPTTTAELYTP